MDKTLIPTTARQAFKILDGLTTAEEKLGFLRQSRLEFTCSQHFGLGLWIRNNWIYEDGGTESDEERKRLDRCKDMLSGTKAGDVPFMSADQISGMFLERYYNHLHRLSPTLIGDGNRTDSL
jgi:hypothetical protein